MFLLLVLLSVASAQWQVAVQFFNTSSTCATTASTTATYTTGQCIANPLSAGTFFTMSILSSTSVQGAAWLDAGCTTVIPGINPAVYPVNTCVNLNPAGGDPTISIRVTTASFVLPASPVVSYYNASASCGGAVSVNVTTQSGVCLANPLAANTFLQFSWVNASAFVGIGYSVNNCTGATLTPPTTYRALTCYTPVPGAPFSFFIRTASAAYLACSALLMSALMAAFF